jgi:hypothetical protein
MKTQNQTTNQINEQVGGHIPCLLLVILGTGDIFLGFIMQDSIIRSILQLICLVAGLTGFITAIYYRVKTHIRVRDGELEYKFNRSTRKDALAALITVIVICGLLLLLFVGATIVKKSLLIH